MRILGWRGRTSRPLSSSRRSLLVLAGVILIFLFLKFSTDIEDSEHHLDSYNDHYVTNKDDMSYPLATADSSSPPTTVSFDPVFTPTGAIMPETDEEYYSDEPDVIINNDVRFPRLPSLSPGEFFALREKHLELINKLIKEPLPTFTEYNVNQLKGLVEAWDAAGKDGTFRQPGVVLSTYGYVPCAMKRPVCSTTGEVIWLESLLDVFKDNNYFLLWDGYDRINKAYKHYGDIVTHVWAADDHTIWCFNDTVTCMESPENPNGIPPWKLFTFTFWGSPRGWQNFGAPKDPWAYNPLGGEWNIVPYRMPDNHFYLGYHFTGCEEIPYVPPYEREDQILILAKRSEYFHLYNMYQFSFWEYFNNEILGMDVILASNEEEGFPVPKGLTWIGPQERHEYDKLLASSKAVFGVGRPFLSPTPYASLCRGVPVILPYHSSRCVARPNSTNWCGFSLAHQHGPASLLGEPYVWMADVDGEVENIIDTVLAAMDAGDNIEEGYQPYDMTIPALTQRIHDFFSIDWQKYGARRMKKNGWDSVKTQEWMYSYIAKHPRQEQKE